MEQEKLRSIDLEVLIALILILAFYLIFHVEGV